MLARFDDKSAEDRVARFGLDERAELRQEGGRVAEVLDREELEHRAARQPVPLDGADVRVHQRGREIVGHLAEYVVLDSRVRLGRWGEGGDGASL